MGHPQIAWKENGFAGPPELHVAGPQGLMLYRCWGYRSLGIGSSEWGTGYFSLEKPSSVLEAELRYNIVDWGNGVNFVSTFRLQPGFAYWCGPVAHGILDAGLPGVQAYVEPPLQVKFQLLQSRQVLKHDVWVAPRDGTA